MRVVDLFVIVPLALIASTQASSIALDNFSFEDADPALADAEFTTVVSDWIETGSGGWGVVNPSVAFQPSDATEGDNAAFANVAGTGEQTSSMYQTPVTALDPDAIYTLTIDLGNLDFPASVDRDADTEIRAFFTLGTDTTDFNEAVGTPLAVDLSTIGEGMWSNDLSATFSTVGFSESLDQELNIALQIHRTAGANGETSQARLDNVRLDMVVVPEPSGMFLLGAAGLVFGRRRRSSRS